MINYLYLNNPKIELLSRAACKNRQDQYSPGVTSFARLTMMIDTFEQILFMNSLKKDEKKTLPVLISLKKK